MKVNIIIFGQLVDITGDNHITVTDISDTDGLIAELNRIYPGLAEASYVVAVDSKVIPGNCKLTDMSTIALLPPFSGG